MRIRELLASMALMSAIAPSASRRTRSFKKSILLKKKWLRRKKRLSISGKSRNLNHRIKS